MRTLAGEYTGWAPRSVRVRALGRRVRAMLEYHAASFGKPDQPFWWFAIPRWGVSTAACSDSGWLRFGRTGPGVSWTSAPPIFSERYGYRTPFLRAFGWRLFWLPRYKA